MMIKEKKESKLKSIYFIVAIIFTLALAIFGSASTIISDAGSTYDADVTMDGASIVLSGGGANIESDVEIDLFPTGQTSQGLRTTLSGGDIVVSALGGTDLKFDDNIFLNSGKNIVSASQITMYPDDQSTYGIRITDTGGVPTIQSLGSTDLIFEDRLELTQGYDVGTDKSIKLYAETSDVIGEPQAIELYATIPEAKPYLAWKTWYDSNDDGIADTYDWTAWLGAHYNTSINSDAHQHWSVETLDRDTGYVNTRFEILLGKPVEELYIGMNAVNYLNLKTGVDIRFTESGTERARIELNTSTKNLEITTDTDKSILLTAPGNGEIRAYSHVYIKDGKNILSNDRLDFYTNSQTTRSFSIEDDGVSPLIKSYGSNYVNIDDEIIGKGIKADGTGKVVCIKSDGALGTCSDAPNSSGVCTCV